MDKFIKNVKSILFGNVVKTNLEKLNEDEPKGMLRDCLIIQREEQDAPWLFYQNVDKDGPIICNLYNYAIIPMEEYTRLKLKDE